MKKKNIILIIVSILILIAVISIIAYNFINKDARKYEIEEVKEYNYFILKQNDLYGVIDREGNKIIEPEYTEIIIPNPEKPVFVCNKQEEVKVLNEKKEQILDQYDNIQAIRSKNISSNLMYEKSDLKYQKEGKYGIIDFNGKILTKPIYDEIESLQYKEGELLVKQNEKYGVITIKGNQLIAPNYEEILVDGYYTEEDGYKYAGYITQTKTEEGYRYGYINYKGEEILNTKYNKISRVNEELEDKENAYLICAQNGQYGVIKNQKTIIENQYQSIRYDESNQVFVIEKSGKYGIANREGKEIIPVQYTQIDITGIYLYAQDEQGITVYNGDGTQANVDANISILNTSNEQYKIIINNSEEETKYGVINKNGKQQIEEKYNYIKYLYDNYFMASENGKLGILDDKGNIKIELKNDSVQQIEGTQLIQTKSQETIRNILK